MNTILVTGGAGYIGSHTTLCLLEAGYEVVVVDNFCNSSPEPLRRVAELAGRSAAVFEFDVRDADRLGGVFRDYKPDAVVHFAGLKAVGESVQRPLKYYQTNLDGAMVLLEAMQNAACHKLVFSSSATVYGLPEALPIHEDESIKPTNPYGQTKAMIESIIRDCAETGGGLRAMLLRYFNPVGAHASGKIGEHPQGVPNNLMPYVAQVAVGQRPELQVFGTDWPTLDGTGVRDYIHVMDLAEAHVAALRALDKTVGATALNVGTGQGHSVLEMIKLFEAVSGQTIRWVAAPRRQGDIATCFANPALAEKTLGWKAQRDAQRMCADAWRWQSCNPEGFAVT